MNSKVSFATASKDYQGGRFLQSLETLNVLLSEQKDAKTYALIAKNLLQLGMKEDAAKAFALAGNLEGKAGIEHVRRAAMLHFECGNEDEALLLALRLMTKTPQDRDIAFILTSIYLKRGRMDLLSPFRKVLAESDNPEHVKLSLFLLSNDPHDRSNDELIRALFSRFPQIVALRLLYLIISRETCDFEATDKYQPMIDALVAQGNLAFFRHESAFYNLQWCEDEALNKLAVAGKAAITEEQTKARHARAHSWSTKLRVGYLSSDYWDGHATMKLLQRVLEQHDRERFEITLYCHTPADQLARNTADRSRWGRVVEVGGMSSSEIGALMRRDGIDIFVDLKGPTSDSRYDVLNHDAAPIQVSWLGYPGSTVCMDVDYVIGDRYVLPEIAKQHYHEKFVRLPDTYQPNDPVHRPAPSPVTRSQLGLPEDKFVFASFNANRKVTSTVVDAWCNILKRAPDSVLWLMVTSEKSKAHLSLRFRQRGIAASRVIFCQRDKYANHISRLATADLALDTWPYNGHTTSSEELWAALPVLTKKGTNFASRVSESLLNAVGLPELVAADTAGYEDMAVALANDRETVQGYKARLEANRFLYPLFDADRFTAHLEDAYEMMADRAKAGLAPDHIDVPARAPRIELMSVEDTPREQFGVLR